MMAQSSIKHCIQCGEFKPAVLYTFAFISEYREFPTMGGEDCNL